MGAIAEVFEAMLGSMTTSRRYGDGCSIAIALDLVGERWALLVVRELVLGPKRFTDLQEGLPGVGPKVLAQRLRELETNDVIRRRTLPPPASSRVYELTEWGQRLESVLVALGQWGADAPNRADDPVSADSTIIRLRTFFRPEPKRSWTATYEIRLGNNRFTAQVSDGNLVEMVRGEPRHKPDTVIDSDPNTLNRILDDPTALTLAIDQGKLTITGDIQAGHRLLATG